MKDLHSNMKAAVAINTTALSTATTTNGQSIDRNGFEALEFVIQSGAFSTGTFVPVVQDCDDNATWVNVADDFLLPPGTTSEAQAAITAANQVKRIGYNGAKRYARCNMVSSGTVSATIGAIAVLTSPTDSPVANN